MEFNFQQFHFANGQWLYGIWIVPAIWVLYWLFYKASMALTKLEAFADKKLLPHLILNKSGNIQSTRSWIKGLFFWSAIWALAMLAMAGPRWNYTEIDSYEPEASLVILLDLSKSMDVDDVKPSRLKRAIQEVEDFISFSKAIKIGLVAFANIPHLVSPITDDVKTIKYLLPSLSTDLVGTQGSSIIPALRMAANLLNNEPGDNKTILVISDGGFEDESLEERVSKITDSKIIISSIGVGTKEGAPIPDGNGGWFKVDGKTVLSKLEEDSLSAIAKIGKGVYIKGSYLEQDTYAVLEQIKTTAEVIKGNSKKQRHWEERFYIPLAVMMLLALPFFRRGVVFPVVLLVCTLSYDEVYASDFKDFFRNQDQKAVKALESENYEKASKNFSTQYNKGVADYKAGKFEEAQKAFQQDQGIDAKYNLGNSYAKQNKFQEAIDAYNDVLKQNPNHEDAKHNLDIVKKLLQQQPKDKNKDEKEDQEQDQQKQDKQEKANGQQKQKNDDNNDGEEEKEQQNQEGGSDKNDKPEDKKDDSKSDEEKSDKNKEQKPENKEGDEEKPEGEDKNEQENKNPFAKDNSEGDDEKRDELDVEADQLLNRMNNDPDKLLKNQFNFEEQKNNKGVSKPW